jgi:hypothetical protein
MVSEHYHAKLKNLSSCGNNNASIFIESLNEILYHTPDTLFVQWTGLNRHALYPLPGIRVPMNLDIKSELHYLDFSFNKERIQQFVSDFLILNHDYHNILLLINYCKILETVSAGRCGIVFINGLVPWTDEIQHIESLKDPHSCFSKYTKELLSVELLPDAEIQKFFMRMSLGLAELNKSTWVNMFDSLSKNSIDTGTDHQHPGPLSHKHYADQIIKHLESWPKNIT